jgi:hypothetical protein
MKFVFEVDTIEQATAVIAALGGVVPAKGGKGKKADDAAASTPSAPTAPVVVAPVPADTQATASSSGKTIEDVKKVVVEAAGKLTVPVVVEILKATAGVQKAGQVPADKFDAVIAAITARLAASEVESLV